MTPFAEHRPTVGLGFYGLFARTLPFSYRNKIMLVAFPGTHIPLLALIAWYALVSAPSLSEALWVIGVALVAILVGTALTLVALNELLQPILMTARGLRRYAVDRSVPALPIGFTDDAGTLMADTVETLIRLEATFKQLAHHDQLTSLPNREYLLEVLARRLAKRERLALCIVTLRNEGVEVEADLKRMQMLGCELFQGYYFSRPMPADKFATWVHDKGALAGE